jgi:peptidyl-prolyl cis-trans isomerase B (cyclophilin B)
LKTSPTFQALEVSSPVSFSTFLIAEGKKINNSFSLAELQGTATVEMIVNGGKIIIELDGENAPITAGNFVDLVSQGFYDGLIFHRVVKAPQPFVAQGGDPQGKGTGGFIDPKTKQERRIPLEIKVKDQPTPTYNKVLGQQGGYNSVSVTLSHKRGAIAMARSQAPDSASSQFYFALSDLDFLDGDYAVFGYVTQGMETVDGIKQGDRITSAKVIKGAENLKK